MCDFEFHITCCNWNLCAQRNLMSLLMYMLTDSQVEVAQKNGHVFRRCA